MITKKRKQFIFAPALLFAIYGAAEGKGIDVFSTECAECHSIKEGKNKKGPSLFGIVGRKAGAIADFKYSDSLKDSGIVWTQEKLQAYIKSPKATVPGGKMKYEGLANSGDMNELLQYLDGIK